MHEATEAALVDDRVAGKAGVVHRLVGGFVVVKVSEPPAAGRGVLDHKLNPVLGWPGHERLETAKGFATFLQRDVIPGEPGNDGAVREWKLPFPVGLDRYVVAPPPRPLLAPPLRKTPPCCRSRLRCGRSDPQPRLSNNDVQKSQFSKA